MEIRTIKYSESSEFLQMEYREFVNWRIGVCIMAIASGDFKLQLEESMLMMVDWQIVNRLQKL